MGSRQIVLVSTAGFSILNTGIFWREAKTKRLFSQCILVRVCAEQFLFWKLRGLIANFHIHVSVSDLYIPRIGPHIWLQQNRQTDPGNI